MQYRKGIIHSTGAAVSLMLGFVPDKFEVYNYTVLAAASATPAVGYSLYLNNVTPSGNALVSTYTSGAPVTTLITSNGFTPVVLGADWQNTIYTITGISNANPGVVTVNPVNPTNSMVLVNGMTVTISGVKGMTGLNTNRFIVAGISGATGSQTFNLYDLFGNPVNTTALGTYISGGELDVISYPPTAPVLDPVTGQVITPGMPAGLQYDIGYAGITLGTGVVGASGNVLWWDAFLATPTGY
jgi:hypothetical protein